jgi:hypothetical protein
MKKIIIFSLLIILPFTIIAQQEMNGALGLIFGMNKENVKSTITNKGGTYKVINESSLTITNLKMGTKMPIIILARFINNKLFEIEVIFLAILESKTQELYNELQAIIENKYGKGESLRKFEGIYEDGDGFEMQAVRKGYATIITFWSDFKNNNAISLEIACDNDIVVVKLLYQDGVLINEVIKKQDEKNAKDF